jgi:hypothetical protein
MTKKKENIIRAIKECQKTSAAIAVMKGSSSLHGTNEELIKQFA